MDFNFKEEQLQFADALKRWVAKDYSFEERGKIIGSRGRRVRRGLGHAGRTGHDGACRCRKRRAASAAARSTCSS